MSRAAASRAGYIFGVRINHNSISGPWEVYRLLASISMFVTKLKPADKIAGESLRPFACSAVPGLPGAVAEDDCMYEALPSRRPPHSPVLSYTAIGRLPSEVTGGHVCSTSPGPPT